ncbi:MAG: hypothetical protein H6557_29665 [Lewinellaceae bacterium]|nr:hypothetical protein [Phaeodactylibacter sp.]MCB9040817.1 hypothetical protein [Lewinellaceae bacterium]
MRRLFLFLSVLTACTVLPHIACRNNNNDEAPAPCSNKGALLGPDYRRCACCGGWLMEISGDTLVAWAVPETFTRDIQPEELPLPVFLEWKDVAGPCQGGVIEVECIRRR